MRFSSRRRGVSLLELLVVMSFIALLALLALPSYRSALRERRALILKQDLIIGIELARREAVLLGISVRLCASEDQEHCSGDWEQGFIVYQDPEGRGRLANPKQIIQTFHRSFPPGRLLWKAFPQQRADLAFTPEGRTAEEDGRFWFYPEGELLPTWALVISKSGRLRVELNPAPRAG